MDSTRKPAARAAATTRSPGSLMPGVPASVIRDMSHAYATAKRAIICWTLGITEHHTAVHNVLSLINLSLLTGHVGRWGMDRVVEPANHAEVEWLYGVPGIAPGSHELFDPDIVDEMYRAIRTLGVTSVSYEPLREGVSSFATVGGVRVPNKDEHRIALFSRILTVMHRRVAEETGTAPLVPEDTFPRRRPRIGVNVQREIRRPKADGFVPKTLQPSLDLGPSEQWEPIEPRMLPRHEQPQFVAW